MESCYIVTNPKEEAFEETTSVVNKTCVCCSSQNKISVNINTCKHTAFLDNYVKFKYNLRDSYICIICHNMLKKIALFQQQVEESIALLTDQAHILKINKLHNLQRTTPHTTDSTNLITSDFEIKPDDETEVNRTDFSMEVKVEHDFSDYETDALADADPSGVPLPAKKKGKRKREKLMDKYEGKIRVITLSLEELKEERENLARQEKYLRLPYKCANCIVGFDHEMTYKNHMETRHKMTKSSFQCDICFSVLISKNSYNEHMKRHVRRLECVECGKRYNHGQSAVQHYHEKHLPDGSELLKGYTCRECGFTTTVNRTYRYHMDKHKQKKECTLCEKTFINLNGLRTHMFTVHAQSPRVYRCSPCGKSYRAKSGLVAHTRSAHAPAPRAYCAKCRTYYMTAHALHTHLNTHSTHVTDVHKRFICDECGSKFIKKSSLQIHINWEHLKLNTHRCTKCSKVFKSAPALRRHINYVHEKQRPPRNKICHFCGRGFTSANILQSHLRTHTGERPLQCAHCRATFAHSGALYTHIKLKHK